MAKNKLFWDIKPILKYVCQYYLIYGERSNGKTYGTLEHCLEEYFLYNKEFAYIRRWDDDIKGVRGGSIFNPLINNNVIKKLSKNKYYSVTYRNRCYYLVSKDKDTGEDIIEAKPFAYAFAVSMNEHYKGNSYPNIYNIVFDEFLTRGAYLDDEFILFTNLLSTLIRTRDGVKIFMLANTVNLFNNPYEKEMGLYRLKNQVQGTIDIYDYGETGLRVACEYTAYNEERKKATNKYFAFNNPRLEMIKKGSWEIDIYPHYPKEYGKPLPKEILYKFFIAFENVVLQCDIIKKEEKKIEEDDKKIILPATIFIFIYPKYSPIKLNETALIYSQDINPKPNYRRRITKPVTMLEKRILSLFAREKVFYSDNMTGEAVRNYIAWCKS